MLQDILDALGRIVSVTDTMFPFPDFQNISLLKMVIGLIILTVIISVITGKENKDE